MADRSSRRRLLSTLATAGLAGLSGCAGLLRSPTADPSHTSRTSTDTAASTGVESDSSDGTGTTTPASVPDDGWPMARHGPGNDAVHPSATGPGGDLSVTWTASFDESGDGASGTYRRSSPLVLGETVVAAADSVRQGSTGTMVVAVDRHTGEGAWRNRYEYAPSDGGATAPPGDTLVSDGHTLYLGTHADGWELRGLDPSDGTERWKRSIDHPLYTPGSAVPGAVFYGERPYAAFDATDGTLLDRYLDDDQPAGDTGTGTRFEFPPTLDDDSLYVPGTALEAIDRETGDVRWSTGTAFHSVLLDGPAWVNSPVVRDGVAYATTGFEFSAGGGIVAVSTDDGSVLWSAIPGDGADAGTVAGADAGTIAGPSDRGGGDGRVPEHGTLSGMALVLEDAVVAYGARTPGEGEPRLVPGTFAYDRSDGSPLWRNEAYVSANMVAADGVVYMGADPVVALDAATGDRLGSAAMDDWGAAGPSPLAVAGDQLFACHSTGLVAFGPG